MPRRESPNPGDSLWSLIAVQLRRHRDERGLSGADLAELFDRDRSTISRLESGEIKLTEELARIADDAWSTGDLFVTLVRFAKEGHDREWFQTHTALEARASEQRIWEALWIPGLLQTESYTRAQVTAAGFLDIDERVAKRMKRQESLNRNPPPLMRVILDEGVITQPVGSPEIMHEQLARLLELAALPNITIRIVPKSTGAHVGRDGSFKILTVDGEDSAYIEAAEEGRLVQDATDVRSFRLRFDRISDRALDADTSMQRIREVMEGFR
ncbi:helix-turn-helix transcriptional regulator [Actinomadura barringtoniae]|uniref:Helix-turn-helix transcriptional regulator n=1 Tax=Actinomadura barringtoniae TaxID=1427535 RepID=A0A939PT77_9ACTN|nr:helix-turn-helix transcriptional regulator [Actinomadura barringtoniae]MBO2455868.1 helix-turn-helix transcriptional regulator [Actinomadura barringtoniae]